MSYNNYHARRELMQLLGDDNLNSEIIKSFCTTVHEHNSDCSENIKELSSIQEGKGVDLDKPFKRSDIPNERLV